MLKDYQSLLEKAFDILNRVYFDSELPPVVISIMSSPKTNGHFTVGKVWRAEEEKYNEINISAEHLDRPIGNILATLTHEMVHYYCQLKGIQDVSQGGRYHNKLFKQEAEKRGLNISYAKYIGYSVTEPSEKFIRLIESYGLAKPIDINRDGAMISWGAGGSGGDGDGGTDGGKGVPVAKKKTSTRKYVCPVCGNSFRATKDIRVLCMDCQEQFIKAGT
nr:SprT-like domain-containing protein [uncultured Eisenbergiella sp.]